MSIAAWGLARPWWLLALLPAALLLWHLSRTPRGAAAAWRQAVDSHLLPHLLVGAAPRRRDRALLAGGLLLAILTLAGPVRLESATDAYHRDTTRVLMVDLSTPMEAARLERVRVKILALLRVLPEGQTALIVYAGEPYLVAPPTTDVETLAHFVPELAPDAMPLPGNRPEHALAMAGGLLARSGSAVRDLVWINVASEGEATRLTVPAGARLSILDAGANPALSAFAAVTGSAYVPISADDADVRELVATLSAGGSWRAAPSGSVGGAELGPWLLLALLPLGALAFRRGVLTLLAVPLLAGLLAPLPADAFELPLPAALADARAWRQLQAGDTSAAAFRDPRWKAVAHYRGGRFEEAAAALAPLDDADALYNRGNALAMQERLVEALTAYEAVLKLRPDDDDARHNRDLVRHLLNQQQKNSQGAGGGAPPAEKPSPPQRTPADAKREAASLAERWLRQVPDEPATLLRRKLLDEHRRRLAGEAPRPW